VEELSQFMSLVSAESSKVQKIKEEKEKRLTPKIDVSKSLGDFFAIISEAKSISPIIEAPKVSEEFEFFPKKLYERITLPNPPADLEKEADKLKTIIANRTSDDEQSIRDHDEHAFYAIDMYCKKHGLKFHDNEMNDIVSQAKPTIKYFKEMFNVARPHRIDPSIKPMSSTTSNTPAYPSGHACQSMLVGLYVSAKFPEHEEGLIEAAKECGMGRVKAGFHYLADYVAGNLLAEKMFLVMNKDNYGDYLNEAPRIPRKKGQPAGSDKHSDLYTDENPKGTIQGLGFKDVETAKASVSKIENSSKTHAHKIQAAIAMEQRAKVMGKKAEAAVYRSFIEKMKKKTKEMNKEDYTHYPTQVDPKKDKSDGWIIGDPTQPIIFDGGDTKDILDKANREVERERQVVQPSYVSEEANTQRIDVLKTFFNRLDKFEETINQRELAQKMKQYMPEQKERNELTQLKEQFNHFRKLVTHQMSTIGGGGAVNLLDLDDIDTSSLGNGKFLVYNSTSGKLEFTDQVDGN
tara:strand:- start:3091 stop:4647 length:1557 start_codon:yes stop_codon:yes gene_type:complete